MMHSCISRFPPGSKVYSYALPYHWSIKLSHDKPVYSDHPRQYGLKPDFAVTVVRIK